MMNNQYFAYIRVSTVKQGEGVSLEAQREAIERYALNQGLSISRWFEEKETAAKQGRPLFTEMIKALKAGKAKGVIMHKIDRSARNLRDWATVGDLSDAGLDVHFAAESVDFTSRGGRLTADIQAVIAADYIRNLREETIKGINGRLKQGLYPFKAPIGYVDNGGGQLKTICPEKGPLVKKLFELYASGSHSINSLTQAANDIGLTGAKGGKIGQSLIERMLSNPFYIGLVHLKSRNKTYAGKHEALVSTDTFKQVEAVRAGRYVKKRVKYQHRFRRVFRCADCHKSFIAERQKGHVYYRCHTPMCPSHTLREEAIEAQVSRHFQKICFNVKDAEQLKLAIQSWEPIELERGEKGRLAIQINDIALRKEKLLDALIDGVIDKEIYEKRNHQLLVLENEVNQRSANTTTVSSIVTRALEIVELFKNPYFTYSLANNDEKRQFLKILYSNRCIRGKSVELTKKNWLIQTQDLLGVSFGPPVPDINRRKAELGNWDIDGIYGALNCPEAQSFLRLCDQIHQRENHRDLPETPTEDSYREAA